MIFLLLSSTVRRFGGVRKEERKEIMSSPHFMACFGWGLKWQHISRHFLILEMILISEILHSIHLGNFPLPIKIHLSF